MATPAPQVDPRDNQQRNKTLTVRMRMTHPGTFPSSTYQT